MNIFIFECKTLGLELGLHLCCSTSPKTCLKPIAQISGFRFDKLNQIYQIDSSKKGE